MIVLNAHNMCPDLTPNVSWILHLIILKENILKITSGFKADLNFQICFSLILVIKVLNNDPTFRTPL